MCNDEDFEILSEVISTVEYLHVESICPICIKGAGGKFQKLIKVLADSRCPSICYPYYVLGIDLSSSNQNLLLTNEDFSVSLKKLIMKHPLEEGLKLIFTDNNLTFDLLPFVFSLNLARVTVGVYNVDIPLDKLLLPSTVTEKQVCKVRNLHIDLRR